MEPFSIATALSALFNSIGPAQLAMFAGSQLLGSMMQDRAARKVEGARAATMAAERQRQSSIDQQRNNAINQALPKFGPGAQTAQHDDIAGKLEQYLSPEEHVALKGEYVKTNPGAPQVIQDGIAGKLSEALSKGKDYAKNLANVSAYGTNNFANAMTMNRLGENVGELNRSGAVSSSIVPLELQAAGNAGRGYSTMADIANGVGTLALLSGGGKAPKTPNFSGTGINPAARVGLNPTSGGASGIRLWG